MSVVLVLFAIALVITCAGLLLSPRSQSRSPQNEYLVTPKGRRIVEVTPVPPRARRSAIANASGVRTDPAVGRTKRRASSGVAAPVMQHARARGNSVRIDPAPPRARASNLDNDSVRRRAGARVSSASVTYPGLWEGLQGRLGSWKVAVPGLIAISLLGFYLVGTVLPGPLFWTAISFGTTNPAPAPVTGTSYTASQHLVRVGQLDPAQYQSMQEFNTWAYSACSAAAMTEVINSYGHTYHITTILEIESSIHEITPEEGLLEEVGIQRTGAKFGFKTTWGHNLSLDQVIAAANSGTPVIVSFPPSKFPGGHVLVVRGGDSNYVYLADSSRLDWTTLSHARFLQLWGGFSAIMTPVTNA